MAEVAEAVARLSLDAQGFDRQAARSLESFTKQLRSVQDATDVVISGAEQLQKRFVKSLGGVAVIGLANALGDAMRDVGAKIGAAGQAAEDAQSGLKGLAGSFSDGAARAEKMQAAASGVAKTLAELNNFTSIKGLVFKAFGGEQTLNDLQNSMQGASDAEIMAGAIRGRNRARDVAGMTPEQIKAYDLNAARQAQIDAAKRLSPDFRDKTVKALQDTFAAEDAGALAAMNRQDAASASGKSSAYDGELYSMQKERESARNRAEFQAGLEKARQEVDQKQRSDRIQQDRERIERRVSAASSLMDDLASAEQRKKAFDAEVISTDAAAAKIAQGVFGSARGHGQRMTSAEIGINRAVDRAFDKQTTKSSQEYRDQVKKELGPGADGYAVDREIQRRRVKDAEERAKAPFDAAREAKERANNLEKYMQHVQDLLNELKTYAHAT